MAETDTFQCTVVTPERAVLDCAATFVAFPAYDGERGVLPNHAPLLCRVGIGRLRVESADGAHLMFVDGGFAEVVDNRLTILTEQAKRPDEIDPDAAEQALIEARAMRITDYASYQARGKAIRRAQVQGQLAKPRAAQRHFR